MRCIDNCCTDIYFNLAAEEYLLKQRTENYFMVWQATPSVVIGKHQSVNREVDTSYAQQQGIRIARRYSGGGAVYHDLGNINFTFIEKCTQPHFEEYLQQTVNFLNSLGVVACSDARMGIFVNGSKISGSAQCIHKDRMMYHCTLLLNAELSVLNATLSGKTTLDELLPGSKVRAVPSVRSKVTNLSEYLPETFDVKGFIRLAYRYFLKSDKGNLIYRFTPEDCMAIERLKQEKYIRREWIYYKSV